MSFIGVVTGIMGMFNAGDNATAIVAFALLEGISIALYVYSEGKVDSNSVKASTKLIKQIVEMIDDMIDSEEEEEKKDEFVVEEISKE